MAMPPFSSQSTGQPGKGVRTDVGRDHGNINVVASRTRWSLEARGSEVASGAAAASGALETETAAVAGRRRTYSGGLGGMGTRPLEGGGPGTCEAAALAGSDPGQRVRTAAPTRRDGVSFYTLVPGEGGWDSCLPVATRRPCRQAQGRRRGARKRCARELCSRETPALRQRQTWRKRGKLPQRSAMDPQGGGKVWGPGKRPAHGCMKTHGSRSRYG